MAQPLQRQFFTTNTAPVVQVTQGSNVFITFTAAGQTRTYKVDVPASGGSGQTNLTLVVGGTNVFVSSATNSGVTTFTVDVPTQLQQTNWSLADITNLTALQISWQQITNVASIQIPLASVTNAGSIAYSNANAFILSNNGNGTNTTLFNSAAPALTIHGGFLSTNDITGSVAIQTNGTLQLSNASVVAAIGLGKSNVLEVDTVPVTKALQVGTNGIVYIAYGAGISNIPQSAITNALPRVLGITIDGGGNTIASGTKGFLEVPYAATVKAGTLLADQNGSIQIETWRTNAGNLTLLARAGSLGTNFLTTTNWSKDYTLSGWSSVAISSNDILGFVVTTNAASCTRVTLQLQVQP